MNEPMTEWCEKCDMPVQPGRACESCRVGTVTAERLEQIIGPGPVVDAFRAQEAKIAELEKENAQGKANLTAWNDELIYVKKAHDALQEAVRWRSCESEPPGPEYKDVLLLTRENADVIGLAYYEAFNLWLRRDESLASPDEWRPIA